MSQSGKKETRDELDEDLKPGIDQNDSLPQRIEALLIQILRELKKGKP